MGRYTQEASSHLYPTEDSTTTSGRISRTTTSPIRILLTFEETSKWPDDLDALRHVKTALLCAIGQKIEHSKSSSNKNRAWLSNDVTSTCVLDVVWSNELFRLEISCPRELILLNLAVSNETIVVGGKRKRITMNIGKKLGDEGKTIELRGPRARALHRTATSTCVSRPAHHKAIHTLHMTNSSYGATVRLCKKWLHTMMLSDAYTHEAIELLVASLYCEPTCRPYGPPNAPMSGFLRFLHLLSTHDWSTDPLCVDPESSLVPSMTTNTSGTDTTKLKNGVDDEDVSNTM